MRVPRIPRKSSARQSLAGRNDSTGGDFFIRNGEILLRLQIAFSREPTSPLRIFTFSQLREATNDFDRSRLLRRDNFFGYYSATLGDRGAVVRVALPKEAASMWLIEQIITEIVILSNICHKNVVKLLGCCLETQSPLVVHESFPGGNLADDIRLWVDGRSETPPWSTRLQIAIDVADALNYLHRYASRPVVHKDVKPWNVLLGEGHAVKLTGFSLSVPIPLGKTQVEEHRVALTYGFTDPEYIATGTLTERVDVYAFGVLLFELLTGKRLSSLAEEGVDVSEVTIEQLWPKVEADACALGDAEGKTDQLRAFAELALRCADGRSQGRPTMKEVVDDLGRIRSMGLS